MSVHFDVGPGNRGSIPGRVFPKIQKMVLDATLLSSQNKKVSIKGKWSSPGNGVAYEVAHSSQAMSCMSCSSYLNGFRDGK